MNKRILYFLINQIIVIQFLKMFKGDYDVSGGVFKKLSYPRFLALSTIKELPFYSPDDVEVLSATKYKNYFKYNKRLSEMQSRIQFKIKLNNNYFLRNMEDNTTFKFDSLSFVIDLHTKLRGYKYPSFDYKISFVVNCENETDKYFLQLLKFSFFIKTELEMCKNVIVNIIQQISLKFKHESAERYKKYKIGKIIQ